MAEECKNSKYNIGWSILRAFMCFQIVTMHCWQSQGSKLGLILQHLNGYVVPLFVQLSFFLFADILTDRNTDKWASRLKRLIVPQIGWTIIYYLVLELVDLILHKNRVAASDFLWQMFTGSCQNINAAMWFQVDLIIITIIYMLVWKYVKSDFFANCVLALISILAVLVRVSELSIKVSDNWPFQISCPFNRLFEIIIYANIGVLIKKYIWPNEKNTVYTCFVLAVVTVISIIFCGRGYGNLSVESVTASSLSILLFGLFGKREVNEKIKNRVLKVTSFTLGIYCMHNLVGTIVTQGLGYIGLEEYKGAFVGCIIIYLICYFVGWLITKLFNNVKVVRMLVE